MSDSWSEFLRAPDPPDHAVQIYGDPDELTESVATSPATGFGSAEPAVGIATPAHREPFAARLAELGWDAARIDRRRLLFTADAEETLDAALEETLGPVDARRVYALIADRIHESPVPAAQLALIRVSEQTPKLAGRILAAPARSHYVQQTP